MLFLGIDAEWSRNRGVYRVVHIEGESSTAPLDGYYFVAKKIDDSQITSGNEWATYNAGGVRALCQNFKTLSAAITHAETLAEKFGYTRDR